MPRDWTALSISIAQKYPSYCVFLLLDADDDCPRDLASGIAGRAAQARPELRVSVVIAKSEFEAWFLGAAESLGGRRNLREDIKPPLDAEAVRDAKGWLARQMPPGKSYKETHDQAAFAAIFDLELAKARSRSFRKLWKEIATLVQESAGA